MTLRTLFGDASGSSTAAVELTKPAGSAVEEPARSAQSRRRLHVARAELVLAAPVVRPLREVPLKPDPLQSFAAAVSDVRPDLGERAEIAIDLLPLTPAAARRLRRRYTRAAATGQSGGRAGQLGDAAAAIALAGADLAVELVDEFISDRPASRTGRPTPTGQGRPSGPRASLEEIAGKFTDPEAPLFLTQILIRVQSEIPQRPAAHLHQIMAAFDAFTGENWWRAHGINLGFRHIGADSVLFRRRFDRRFESGGFRPRRRNLVASTEIAGLLKPPTKHCDHFNVARSGGRIPPVPRGVPVYDGQPNVVPVGYAPGPDGHERLYGMPVDDLFFSFRVGKSRFGKTETALVQAVAMALGGHGVWFLDPHADGWTRARPMLTAPEITDKLWEINLTVREEDARIAGYNPLAMAGQSAEHIEDKVDAVVTGISSAMNWGDSAPRAKTILTKACETLCHLALRVPTDCAPTIFQIRTLLDDADWREKICPFLPPGLAKYWAKTYPKYPADATPTITNIIERLAASRTLSAFFGSSASSYDVRHAMDTGKVVFLCPPGGDIGRLVSCLLIYDLFRAGRSRVDTPTDRRRRFDAYVDELTAVDGAARGHLAGILEQLAKYGIRLHAMTQMAQRLTAGTRDALLQNQSLLSSTASELDAARIIAKQWARWIEPQTIVDLPRFHHAVAVTIDGQVTTPFKVRGAQVTELFARYHRPQRLPEQVEAIDANLQRRPIRDTLADLETLDDRILTALGVGPSAPDPHKARPGPSEGRNGRSKSTSQHRAGRQGRRRQSGSAQDAAPTPGPVPADPSTGSAAADPPRADPGQQREGRVLPGPWTHDVQ